jgi:hypothetical protein
MHTGGIEMYGPLGADTNGIRLGEHEPYEHTVRVLDTPQHKDTLYASALWVEDTIGNRHEVPCREHLRTLREMRKRIDFGIPTR